MNIVAMLSSQGAQTYRVIRQIAKNRFPNGVRAPGRTIEIEIFGLETPASGSVIDRLEEGDRNKEVLTFYTAEKLQVEDERKELGSDVVWIRDQPFVVQTVKAWTGYFESTLLSMNQSETKDVV